VLISPHLHAVTHQERVALKAHQPACLWFTGLSGSGKSTIANAVDLRLNQDFQAHTYLLDGDNIRAGLNQDLDFSLQDRQENIRRLAEVAKLFVDAGLIVLTAFISPLYQDRERARQIITSERFIEIYVECPLAVCEQRDPKGMYRKARQGELPDFTGIDSPYEAPLNPEIILPADKMSIDACAAAVVAYLLNRGVLNRVRTV
jgi:adenylyl-sulfate kinase